MKTLQQEKRRLGRSWGIWVAVVAAVAGAAFGGCGDPEPPNTTSSSGSSGSSSGSSSSGGFNCTGDTDCVGFDHCSDLGQSCDCFAVGCVSGYCNPIGPLPAGMPAKNQLDGDCSTKVCDGQGLVMAMEDPADIKPDANDCTNDVCSMGFPAYTSSAEGTPCPLGLCDGQGICIQCVDTTQCSNGTVCLSSICVPPMCDNGMQDVGESDVDCGSSCVGCALGKKCLMNDDCQTGTCFEGLCK